MYEDSEIMSEEEVVSNLIALLHGEAIEDTMLDGSRATTFSDGGYLTRDEGFVLYTPDGSKFQITVRQV
ncbi:MAG: hypothetical protein E7318_01835 [Clostridiales bacterium]|nr:hypothetical protein [Clostridiales bacterium]